MNVYYMMSPLYHSTPPFGDAWNPNPRGPRLIHLGRWWRRAPSLVEVTSPFIQMYVCIYLSIYLCIYVSMDVCMYACIDVCMHVCMCACMPVCMYACMYGCMYVCMHACIHVWMHVIVHVHLYIYMHQILELNIVMNMMMNLHEALRCCSRRPFLDDGSAKHGRFPSPCQINYWRREWWTLIILIWSRLILGWVESGLGNTPKAKWWV